MVWVLSAALLEVLTQDGGVRPVGVPGGEDERDGSVVGPTEKLRDGLREVLELGSIP